MKIKMIVCYSVQNDDNDVNGWNRAKEGGKLEMIVSDRFTEW